jgi:hypothetical protein
MNSKIMKTGYKGSAKWELKIKDKNGLSSTVYARKKIQLLKYIDEMNSNQIIINQ